LEDLCFESRLGVREIVSLTLREQRKARAERRFAAAARDPEQGLLDDTLFASRASIEITDE
jgi:hypothetical protein